MNHPIEASLLFDVFDDLRRQGVALGLEEYLVVSRMLEKGKGLESYADLKRLCQLVWATSHDDLALIDQAFSRIIDPWLLTPLPMEPEGGQSNKRKGAAAPRGSPQPGITQDLSTESDRQEETGTQQAEKFFKALPVRHARGSRGVRERFRSLHHFVLTPRWPVPIRTMATTWRVIRQPRRQGGPIEWDVEATIARTAQGGMFVGPVFRPVRTNQAHMLLLVDQGGSMVPFSPLIKELKDSLHLAGFGRRLTLAYFHDVPFPRVYSHPGLLKGRPLKEVLSRQPAGCHVVIVSDGGAARGLWDSERANQTRQAIATIKRVQPNPAWLNPMPADRWRNTTAQETAMCIVMLPWSKIGMQQLVNYVRGQYRTPVSSRKEP